VPAVIRSRSCNDLTTESGDGGSLRGGTSNRGASGGNSLKITNSKSPPLQMNTSIVGRFFPHVKSSTLERKSPRYTGNNQAEKHVPDRIVFGQSLSSPPSGNGPAFVGNSASPVVRYTTSDESLLPGFNVSNGGAQVSQILVSTGQPTNVDSETRARYNLVTDPTTSSKVLVATVQLSAADYNGLNPRDLVVQSSKSGRRIHVTTRTVSSLGVMNSSPSRLNLSLSLPYRVDPYDILAGLDSNNNLVIEAAVVE